MAFNTEIKFDFDRAVATEARFALRKTAERFIELLNTQVFDQWSELLSKALVVEGFSDFVELKEGFVESYARKFRDGNRLVRFPELKLSLDNVVYKLTGTYEEYANGLLVKEGRITIELILIDERFLITKIYFDPRILVTEE